MNFKTFKITGVNMNITKKYFVNLISAFLNNKQSIYRDDIDYNELYRLGNMHNVCGIIAKQLMGFNAGLI